MSQSQYLGAYEALCGGCGKPFAAVVLDPNRPMPAFKFYRRYRKRCVVRFVAEGKLACRCTAPLAHYKEVQP